MIISAIVGALTVANLALDVAGKAGVFGRGGGGLPPEFTAIDISTDQSKVAEFLANAKSSLLVDPSSITDSGLINQQSYFEFVAALNAVAENGEDYTQDQINNLAYAAHNFTTKNEKLLTPDNPALQ